MKAEDDIAKPTNLKWSKTSKDGLEYAEACLPKPKLPLDMSSFERKPFLDEVPVIEPVPVIENNIVNEAINNFAKQRDETTLPCNSLAHRTTWLRSDLNCLQHFKKCSSDKPEYLIG